MNRVRQLKRILTRDEINGRVKELGVSISDYYDSTPDLLIIGLLKGSFIFLADLVRNIRTPHEIAFLGIESYGDSMQPGEQIAMTYNPGIRMRGRSVLLVDDIIDSGNTVNYVIPFLQEQGAGEIQVCALLHKRKAGNLKCDVRWVGFDAPQDFLVGYGLDLGEQFRHLPYIAAVVGDS
ncbi:MAG: hypoxanthine phosphoribosyltransferase [Gammaproteobacteria bacterium]|nr:hypoxanthine phosphoribosyltransferase [Gammaproteobacteria bacterium]MDE0244406.1 hypoxanthine phosphoribosyltransferase [Gammaproteobacteria bacterium]